MIDIDKIKADLDEVRMMDIEAEVQKRLQNVVADLRDEVEKERDDRIAKLEHALEIIDEYDVEEEDDCEDADVDCEADDEEAVTEEEATTIDDVIPTVEA